MYCKTIIGEGQFGFVFDVRPGKEKEAKALRLAWREDKEGEDITPERERNNFNDMDEEDAYEIIKNAFKEKEQIDDFKNQESSEDDYDYYEGFDEYINVYSGGTM